MAAWQQCIWLYILHAFLAKMICVQNISSWYIKVILKWVFFIDLKCWKFLFDSNFFIAMMDEHIQVLGKQNGKTEL